MLDFSCQKVPQIRQQNSGNRINIPKEKEKKEFCFNKRWQVLKIEMRMRRCSLNHKKTLYPVHRTLHQYFIF